MSEESAKEEKETEEKDGEEKDFESVINNSSLMICIIKNNPAIYGKLNFKESQFKKVFSPPPETCWQYSI